MDTQHAENICLCVGDFVVKYYSQGDEQYLINALKETYELKANSQGKLLRVDIGLSICPRLCRIINARICGKDVRKLQHKHPLKPKHFQHE